MIFACQKVLGKLTSNGWNRVTTPPLKLLHNPVFSMSVSLRVMMHLLCPERVSWLNSFPQKSFKFTDLTHVQVCCTNAPPMTTRSLGLAAWCYNAQQLHIIIATLHVWRGYVCWKYKRVQVVNIWRYMRVICEGSPSHLAQFREASLPPSHLLKFTPTFVKAQFSISKHGNGDPRNH